MKKLHLFNYSCPETTPSNGCSLHKISIDGRPVHVMTRNVDLIGDSDILEFTLLTGDGIGILGVYGSLKENITVNDIVRLAIESFRDVKDPFDFDRPIYIEMCCKTLMTRVKKDTYDLYDYSFIGDKQN